MKLFGGEYEPADNAFSIKNARLYFLTSVRNEVPEVLEELFELYLSIYRHLGKPYATYQHLESSKAGTGKLRDILLIWANSWRLETDWCLEAAMSTLNYWKWCGHDRKPDLLMWQLSGYSWASATQRHERRFFFEHDGWEPTTNYRKKIKDEITLAFNEGLERYLDNIESRAVERGFVKSKNKREIDHFDWLACFQVKGMSYEEVRDRFKPTPIKDQAVYLSDDTKTIRQANNNLARFIALPLRPEGIRPGRPSRAK